MEIVHPCFCDDICIYLSYINYIVDNVDNVTGYILSIFLRSMKYIRMWHFEPIYLFECTCLWIWTYEYEDRVVLITRWSVKYKHWSWTTIPPSKSEGHRWIICLYSN